LQCQNKRIENKDDENVFLPNCSVYSILVKETYFNIKQLLQAHRSVSLYEAWDANRRQDSLSVSLQPSLQSLMWNIRC